MHANAERVQRLLEHSGTDARVVELTESARTSQEAADSLGVDVGQIAKSLVFRSDRDPILVVASGADRVDTAALGRLLGKTIRRADANVVRAATGYPIGGVSPVGLPEGLPVYVDAGLARYDVVWAAAGTPHTVFPTTYDQLLRISGGQPVDVADVAAR